MSANCVVVVVVTSVEINVTVMVSFSCMIEESGFESEVSEELLSEGQVGPLCWSLGEVSVGWELG
jgi:hypothetical protein